MTRTALMLAALSLLAGACTSRSNSFVPPPADASTSDGSISESTSDAALGEARIEASAELDEDGGALSVRAGASYVYLSLPAGALERRSLVRMWVTPSSSGGTLVEFAPTREQLSRSAELRVTCAEHCHAWRLDGDDAEPLETRSLPGAVVVRLPALSGRFHFGASEPLPR